MMDKDMRFKNGDVVTTAIEGGCRMTIERIDAVSSQPAGDDTVHCVWFDGASRVCRQVFYRRELIHVAKEDRNKEASAPENFKLVSQRKVIEAIRNVKGLNLGFKEQMALEAAIYELPTWSEAEPYEESSILDHVPYECRECGSYLVPMDLAPPPGSLKLELDALVTHWTTALSPMTKGHHDVRVQVAYVNVICRACLTDHRVKADALKVSW